MILHEDECEDRKLAEQLKTNLEEDAYDVIMSSDVKGGQGRNNGNKNNGDRNSEQETYKLIFSAFYIFFSCNMVWVPPNIRSD